MYSRSSIQGARWRGRDARPIIHTAQWFHVWLTDAVSPEPSSRRATSPAALDNEPAPASGTDRLTAIASLSSALVRAKDKQAVARILIDTCLSLLAVDMAAVALVSEDTKRAQGLLAAGAEGDLDWWTSVAVDFDSEPSGIASAVFAGGPVVVYDIASSQQVNRGLAERSGARSAVFVPLVSEERVPAVLVLATTKAPRAFTGDELSLIQALAAEAALAFDRARSADALADALERERLVASIGRKVRSELDLDDVLRVAVESTGSATGVSRCFLRLGEPSNPMPIAAEWTAPGSSHRRRCRPSRGLEPGRARPQDGGRRATFARSRPSTMRRWAGRRRCRSSTAAPCWRRRSSCSTA